MSRRFLDTNIFLRYLARDDEGKASAALALLMRVEQGEERVVTSAMVIFETIFTLEKSYGVPKTTIRERLENIISMRGLQLTDKALYYRALELYVDKNVSFADAYNSAFVQTRGESEIYSWDSDFDKVEGIRRLEPQDY